MPLDVRDMIRQIDSALAEYRELAKGSRFEDHSDKIGRAGGASHQTARDGRAACNCPSHVAPPIAGPGALGRYQSHGAPSAGRSLCKAVIYLGLDGCLRYHRILPRRISAAALNACGGNGENRRARPDIIR
jgi:hypothetical protein